LSAVQSQIQVIS